MFIDGCSPLLKPSVSGPTPLGVVCQGWLERNQVTLSRQKTYSSQQAPEKIDDTQVFRPESHQRSWWSTNAVGGLFILSPQNDRRAPQSRIPPTQLVDRSYPA